MRLRCLRRGCETVFDINIPPEAIPDSGKMIQIDYYHPFHELFEPMDEHHNTTQNIYGNNGHKTSEGLSDTLGKIVISGGGLKRIDSLHIHYIYRDCEPPTSNW